MAGWRAARSGAALCVLLLGFGAAPAAAVPITFYDDTNSSGDYDPGEEVTGATGGDGGSSFAWEFDLDGSSQDLSSALIDLSFITWDNSFEVVINGVVVVPEDPSDPSVFTPAIATPWTANSNGLPRLVMTFSSGSIDFAAALTSGATSVTSGLVYSQATTNPVFVDGQNTIVITNPDGAGPDAIDFTLSGSVTPTPEPGSLVLALLGLTGLAVLGRERRPPATRRRPRPSARSGRPSPSRS